jgi:multicomponent Na+:H+ antiporter subunit E
MIVFKILRKAWQAASFLVFFIWELSIANLRIAYDVITPAHHMKPGIVAIPLEARTAVEITILANLISFTPGTLTVDVSEDRKTLYVHVLYIDRGDVEDVRRNMKRAFEARVLKVLR